MNNQFDNQVKTWMNEWKKQFEAMQLQFNLGKMDAADSFEQFKQLLHKSITEWKESMDTAGDKGNEMWQGMHTKMDELMVQLNLGKADSLDAFKEQKAKIETMSNELMAEARKAYNDRFNDMMQLFDASSRSFRTGIEILQLQFALGKMDAKENTEEVTAKIKEKMREVADSYNEFHKLGMQYLETWNQQMQAGIDKFKSMAEMWMKK